MRNKSGGSDHDPSAKLPPAMWDRPVRATAVMCRACANRSTGKVDSPMMEVPRTSFTAEGAAILQTAVNSGALGPLALICRHCDHAVPVPA